MSTFIHHFFPSFSIKVFVSTLLLCSYAIADTLDEDRVFLGSDYEPLLWLHYAYAPHDQRTEPRIARFLDENYFYANEFERRAILEKIRPVIDEKEAQAKAYKYVVTTESGRLSEYNFDKQVFPTNFNNKIYSSRIHDLKYSYQSQDMLYEIPMSFEEAQSLVETHGSQAHFDIEIVSTVVDAGRHVKVGRSSGEDVVLLDIESAKFTIKDSDIVIKNWGKATQN